MGGELFVSGRSGGRGKMLVQGNHLRALARGNFVKEARLPAFCEKVLYLCPVSS